QVSALTTAGVAALSTSQVAAIETVDVAALKTNQIAALTTAGVAALTTNQVVALTTAQVSSLTTAGMAALTTNQVAAIETVDVAALKTSQVAALSTSGVAALTTSQVQAVSTAGIAALKTAQVSALTTNQVVALTTAQIASLTTAAVAALSTSQVAAIETVDIAALRTSQVVALTTNNIVALTTNQVQAFTTTQAEALTSTQIAAFTTAQISHLTLSTPIILDMNGDGVKTLSISSGVKFDLFADGNQVNTGWVSGGDGLLVMDRNHDGVINDGSELFGSSTTLASGAKASDGYAALSELDANHDGVVNSDDAGFADLRVWIDANSDGVSASGEVKTLASLGITSISTQATVQISQDNGNLIGLTSSYETSDGATHAAADVWFVADKSNSDAPTLTVDQVIAALNPSVQTMATAVGTAKVAESIQPTLAADAALPASATTAVQSVDLRSRVSSLAQAMGTFDSSAPSDGLAVTRVDLPVMGKAAAATLAVGSMVDVMKQFDANGNMVGGQSGTIASVAKSLNLPGIQDPADKGFLAGTGGK
ncbi:ABC-type transporter Mla MlaB component, partial [Rhodoferax ferrireducens]|nr:ABC-type transporter Mla MlaB component [Rhodoferax ferrireducens]